MASSSWCSINRFAIMGDRGEPIASLLIELVLALEVGGSEA